MTKSIAFAGVAALALAAGVPLYAPVFAQSAAADAPPTAEDLAGKTYGSFGVDLTSRDLSVKPGDDFDRYVNGTWFDSAVIADDQSSIGTVRNLRDLAQRRVRAIITQAPAGSQIGSLYTSFMDTARIDAAGYQPIAPLLERIAAVQDRDAFTRYMGGTVADFGSTLVGFGSFNDLTDPTVNTLALSSGGLGLPTRDYYLDARFAEAKAAYSDYLQRTFEKIGYADPAASADAVLAFETRVAEVSWKPEDFRDIRKLNNVMTLAELQTYAPGIDYAELLAAGGIATPPATMIALDNTAIRDIAAIYAETPLDVLKAWQVIRTVDGAANYLSDDFVQSKFAFSRVLSGNAQLQDRWKRGVALIDGSVGELVGKIYADTYFPPEAKAQMQGLVANLKAAMAHRIEVNDWMSADTKAAARDKLDRMMVMVAYPDTYRDFSSLRFADADLIGNMRQVFAFNWQEDLDKIGKPVDKLKWSYGSQTVNASNYFLENKLVFPAGYLQAPNFSMSADPAVNYGAIGSTIGHEIIHGFDDSGRRIDGTGALRDWWNPADATKFDAEAAKYGAQFAKYEIAPGHFVNPDLTMGENIADLGGLVIAYEAYRASLGGREAPVIDGLTGDQRFFLSYAQSHQIKQREAAMITQVASDPHSPDRFRILGTLRNFDPWYAAFDVQPSSPYYLAPEDRVRIW